uniref:Orf120b n=1 Tax=Batis maritima TaxID=4436 RepID=A0A068BEA2_BATMA|nr:orf120b [Batis maritima]AIC83391.1 orf120b [Batis maritima]
MTSISSFVLRGESSLKASMILSAGMEPIFPRGSTSSILSRKARRISGQKKFLCFRIFHANFILRESQVKAFWAVGRTITRFIGGGRRKVCSRIFKKSSTRLQAASGSGDNRFSDQSSKIR